MQTTGGAEGSRTTVVDARWIDKAGTTTFTRQLLDGLAEVRPPGRWILWGPPAMTGPVTWPGAVRVPTSADPVAWFGQRSVLRVPAADFVVHPHQTRPFHRTQAATCVLDLIQLGGKRSLIRAAKTARLAATVKAAQVLFTISTAVCEELVETFDVDPASVTVLHLPVDAAAAARVAARRSARPPERYLLAIGRFEPYKNHRRLIEAFAQSRFAAGGGELRLVGGTVDQLALTGPVPDRVRILGAVGQEGLEDALAGALAVIQPSLVEGYGLPVTEALMAGVPVTSSPIPAVTEFGPEGLPTFDPRSVPAITRAIDETIELVDGDRYWAQVHRDPWVAVRPTQRTLAEQVLAGLATVAGRD